MLSIQIGKHMTIKRYYRPGNNKKLITSVLNVVLSVTGEWFTKEVAEYIADDLKYQDLIGCFEKNVLIGFIVFTCIDGKITITTMAVRKDQRKKGYGTKLYESLEKEVINEGYKAILVQTVPEEVNRNYKSTIEFYIRMGFKIKKRYSELWENGAIELEKEIADGT